MTLRILITGSRACTDKRIIGQALGEVIGDLGNHLIIPGGVGGYSGPLMQWGQITVVHGAARGADTIAGRIATAWGMVFEPHPVTGDDWRAPCQAECKPGHRRIGRGGRDYCPAAGNYRNQRMVDLGADVCIAFPLGVSRGTRDCMERAEAAGIPVRCYEPVVAS